MYHFMFSCKKNPHVEFQKKEYGCNHMGGGTSFTSCKGRGSLEGDGEG